MVGEINRFTNTNSHMTPSGYAYEFYINGIKYTGRSGESNGKIGQRINVSYYVENPWINERLK